MNTTAISSKWMIYGATGYTGKLIAEEAVRRGHHPIIAGRDAEKVSHLAHQMGLEWTAFGINDNETLCRNVEGVDLVLNTASPFAETGSPLMDACISARCHYLDISNEISLLQQAQTRQQRALAQQIAIIPGVGFGTVASNSLASYVCKQVADPVSLEIAISPYVAHKSVGATRSTLETIARGGYVRRNSIVVATPFGAGARMVRFGDGDRCVVPVPSGDLQAAAMATGVANITVYVTSPFSPVLARLVLPYVQKLLSWERLRQRLVRVAEQRILKTTTKSHRDAKEATGHSWLWARAANDSGRYAESWLQTGEGYAFTASTAILAVEWVLRSLPTGVFTAATFGDDFVLQVPGVRRYDGALEYC